MEEASDRLVDKVQALSDIELAVLVCLVAEQHCIVEAEEEGINAVQEELKLVFFFGWLEYRVCANGGRLHSMCLDSRRRFWTAMNIPRSTISAAVF